MFLLELAGSYSGTNHLILSPAEPPRASAATAKLTLISRGKTARLVNGDGDLAVNTHFHPTGNTVK